MSHWRLPKRAGRITSPEPLHKLLLRQRVQHRVGGSGPDPGEDLRQVLREEVGEGTAVGDPRAEDPLPTKLTFW